MKLSRPDLEVAVSFLCTHVKAPMEVDWGKLRRVMRFIKHTINNRCITGTDDIPKLEIWIDASHAVHEDMKGVTGGCMSMGWGVLHAKASKQMIYTKSTCESELIGFSEYIPFKIQRLIF